MKYRILNDLNIFYLYELNKIDIDDYKKFKYKYDESYLKLYQSYLNNVCFDLLYDFDYILPIDNSFHCFKLSCILSKKIKVPIFHVFSRLNTYRQSTLGIVERFANAKNSFSFNYSISTDAKVIIFDDVVTTGATLLSAYDCLIKSGFNKSNIFIISFFSIKFSNLY